MNSKRAFYLMIASTALLVVAIIGGAYLASQRLQQQSAVLTDYKLQHQVLQAKQVDLVKAKKDIATYSPLETIAKTIVPQDKDQAQTVREIIKIAADSGISPTGITFPVSTLGNATVTGTALPPSGTGSAASASSLSKQALSQLTPVKGMSGVYDLQITIRQDTTAPVPYSRFINFLSRLEQNRRTAQVSGVVLQPSTLDPSLVSFTLTLDEFIKP